MRRPPSAGLALGAFMLALTPPLAGQTSPLALDVRVGAGVPVASFAEASPAGGRPTADASFGVHFDYGTGARTGVYLGFSQHRLGCAEPRCPDDGDYVHTGWDVGARLALLDGPVRPVLRLGAVFARVERDVLVEGEVERRLSDLSAGAEAGLEVAVPLAPRLDVAPAVRYVWLNTRFPGDGVLRMRYVVTDVAVVLGF